MTNSDALLFGIVIASLSIVASAVGVILDRLSRKRHGAEREHLLDKQEEHERVMTRVRRIAEADTLDPDPDKDAAWHQGYWACQRKVMEALKDPG